MRVRAVCPRCGAVFYVDVDLSKGKGAHYGGEIRRLSRLHREILRVLDGAYPEGLTKRAIARELYRRGLLVSGNSVSGRLSELLGAGLVRVERTRVREWDPGAKQYRFVKKPVWFLTPEGWRRLKEEVRQSG